MSAFVTEIQREMSYASAGPRFNRLATNVIVEYIRIMYAASKTPINLDMTLNLLFSSIFEAKEAIFIERNKYDMIIQLFQHRFDILCEEEFKTPKKRNRREILDDVNSRALRCLAKNAPTIIEPKYE